MNEIDEQLLSEALRDDAGSAWAPTEGWDMIMEEAQRRTRQRRRGYGALATVAVAAALAGAVWVYDGRNGNETVTVQPTPTTIAEPSCPVNVDGVPNPAANTARAIVAAACRQDYDGLQALMADPFEIEARPGGPDSSIGVLQQAGPAALEQLRDVFRATPMCVNGSCSWNDQDLMSGTYITADGAWPSFYGIYDRPVTVDPAAPMCSTRGVPPGTIAADLDNACENLLRALIAEDWDAIRAAMADDFFPAGGIENAGADDVVAQWQTASANGDAVLQPFIDTLTQGHIGPSERTWYNPTEEMQWVRFDDAGLWSSSGPGD